MKKTKTILAAILLLTGSSALAQDFRSGYFLDNFSYGYRLNPSLQPDSVRVLFGGIISNIQLSPEMNAGLNDFIFVNNGKTVTGLNSAIPSSQFPGNLSNSIIENTRFNENILTIAWRGHKNNRIFNTLEINLRTNESLSIPTTFFEFLKEGGQGSTYDISDLNFRTYAFGELAYGFSIKNEHWDFGGRLKALVGLANLNANINRMTINIGDGKTSVSGQGTCYFTNTFLEFGTDTDGTVDFSPETGNMSPGGYGAAIDFGATWHNNNGLSITFGVTDLGMIKWKNSGLHASFNNEPEVIDQETLQDDFSDIFSFKKDNEKGGGMEMIPVTCNAGIRYHMPFYQGLSVGALTTYRLDGIYSWYEARGGITITPFKALSLTGNYALNSLGNSLGAALSIKIPGINFFIGMDTVPTSFTKQFIPTEKFGAMTINAGLVLAIK